MPRIYHRNLPNGGELGVWHIEETEAYFLDRLELFPSEVKQFSKIKGRLRLEWLASRWLLHTMSGRFLRGPCLKDCLLYTSPSPRDLSTSRMPSSA